MSASLASFQIHFSVYLFYLAELPLLVDMYMLKAKHDVDTVKRDTTMSEPRWLTELWPYFFFQEESFDLKSW